MNNSLLSFEQFTVWTRELLSWLSRKFGVVSGQITTSWDKIDDVKSDVADVEEKVDEVKSDVADVKTAVENINVESADQLAQFFGVADSYEAEAKGGERTNNTVIDECKVRFQDAFNGLLPTGFTMPNSVTVDNLTYTGTTNS